MGKKRSLVLASACDEEVLTPAVAFSDLSDEDAITHLETEHFGVFKGWRILPEPQRLANGLPRRFRGGRRHWDIYHDTILHKGEIMTAGKSIFDMMWEELDKVVADILGEGDGFEDEDSDKNKGMALGIATCLAIMINPYAPDVDAVRTEAMRRWESRDAA